MKRILTSILMAAAGIAGPFVAPVAAQSGTEAQTGACPYTNESLQGTWAVISNYGAYVAMALGVRHYDGKGNLTDSAIINEPTAGSTTGARTIGTSTDTGTYVVNCDGTGTITRYLVAVVNGQTITHTSHDDFVITGAVRSRTGDLMIATTIVDAMENPTVTPPGLFII